MPLKQLLADGRLKPYRPSRREMQERLAVVDRNLRDAIVGGISDDLKHQTAYGAAFILATMVVSASGYRTAGEGHHWVTFEVLSDLLGESGRELAEYFDQARSQRNRSQYDSVGDISGTDASELLIEAKKFRGVVLAWLKKNHASVAPR